MTSWNMVDYPKALKHVKENNITDCIILCTLGGEKEMKRQIKQEPLEKVILYFNNYLTNKNLVFIKNNKFVDYALINEKEVPKDTWNKFVLFYLKNGRVEVVEVNYSPNGIKDCNTCEDRILKETIKILKEDFNYELKIKETK